MESEVGKVEVVDGKIEELDHLKDFDYTGEN